MAYRNAVSTDTQIDQAIERASALLEEPRVVALDYAPGAELDLLILKLSGGRRLVIPREDLQGLQGASSKQIRKVEILGDGTGLHWPELNVDHYLPSLLRHVYGTKRWMAEIGRTGGLARTALKRRASRANGLKGGRPKRNAQIVTA
jgi:Protein of unknown function (DUF2442)